MFTGYKHKPCNNIFNTSARGSAEIKRSFSVSSCKVHQPRDWLWNLPDSSSMTSSLVIPWLSNPCRRNSRLWKRLWTLRKLEKKEKEIHINNIIALTETKATQTMNDRTETIESNIFKSSQSNIQYKTHQLVYCDAYATLCYFTLDFTFTSMINSLH